MSLMTLKNKLDALHDILAKITSLRRSLQTAHKNETLDTDCYASIVKSIGYIEHDIRKHVFNLEQKIEASGYRFYTNEGRSRTREGTLW